MGPLIFDPYLRPMVWGGRSLGSLFGKSLPTDGPYGESWELSPHPHHVSRVAEGPLAGWSLADLCRDRPREIFGTPLPADLRFPLLIKLLDCRELLSIQVHPTDELARRLAGETFGKTEAWVILHAEAGARIYAGFKRGVTRAEVEHRLADGTLDAALHAFTPRPGDCVFLPAGTVHAVGGGVVMAEVQQASDATFRLYDWNRLGVDGKPRPLHIHQALEAIDWSAGPVEPLVPEVATGCLPGVKQEGLVRCPNFGLDRISLESDFPVTAVGRPSIWMVLSGAARLSTREYGRVFRAGETVLVPAAVQEVSWSLASAQRRATLLCVNLPL